MVHLLLEPDEDVQENGALLLGSLAADGIVPLSLRSCPF
jgi:hypothetical protein